MWAIAITVTTFLAATMWFLRPAAPAGSLTIGFDGFTNYEDDRVAVFDLTNYYKLPVYFFTAIERKTANGWLTYRNDVRAHYSEPRRVNQDNKLQPGETYRLLAIVPTGDDFSAWRLSVIYVPIKPAGKFDRARLETSTLANQAGLSQIAKLLSPNADFIEIHGPEIPK